MKKRQEEMEAVRTTIVGGRPPGSGRSDVAVPRGIEVLVKKAAVDEEFRQMLLTQRGAAAATIGLELDAAESAILSSIQEDHLARIIDQTVVPMEQRRVFLGRVAAAMLAALGAGLAISEADAQYAGASGGLGPGVPVARPATAPAPSTQPTTMPSTQPASRTRPTTRPFGGVGVGTAGSRAARN
jgi:hypothetical protein